MRGLKKYIIWLAVIIAIQSTVLYSVNKYFHVDDIAVAAPMPPTSVDSAKELQEEDKGEVALVGTSFDKKYYAIAYKKRVEIYQPKDAKPIFGIDVPDGMHVTIMHWLPDEARMLYALANTSRSKSGRIEIHVVDVTSSKDQLVKDLSRLRKGSHVIHFALSTYTNLLYLDVEDGRKSDSIYQINIMNRMHRISLPSYKIGNVALASKEELLFYEDSIRKQVFSYNGRRIKMITPDDWDYCLLGITRDDELYIGRLNDGKVISIFKADKDGKMDLFADLSHEVPKENILQGLNGQLVIKDFPTGKYIAVIRPNGTMRTFNSISPESFVTGDAIFYMEDGQMHITYLE